MPNSDVVIDLIARDRKFGPAMKRVQRILKATVERMKRVSQAAKRMLLVGTAALAGFIKLATVQENAVKGLEAALTSAGLSTEVWSKQLQAAATQIQKTTTVGDEASLVYMTMALNLGITADKLVEATKGGLGLAKALGQDAQAGIRNFALALNNNFMMLSRYIPAIRDASNDTEKMALVSQIASRGFEQMQAEVLTSAGKLVQLKNSLGDLGEEMGAIFLPLLDKMVLKLQSITPLISDWIKKNGTMILSFVKWTAALGVALVLLPKLVTAIAALIKVVGALKIAFTFLSPVRTAIVLLGTAVIALGGYLALTAEKAEDLGDALQKRNKDFAELNRLQRALSRTSSDDLETQAKLLSRIVAIRGKIKEELDPRVTQITKEFNEALEKEEELLAKINGVLASRATFIRKATAEEKKLTDQLNLLVSNLQLSVDTYGESAEAITRERLARAGANEEQIKTVRLLQEQLSAQKLATEESEKQADISEKAADKISELRKEILLLTGARTEDQLELIDLRNLGVAKEQLKEIELLMEARRRATAAQGDIAAGTSSTSSASISGRIDSLSGLFNRIQSAAAGIQERVIEQNADNNRRSADSNKQTAGLLGQISPLITRIMEAVESKGTTQGAVFGGP